MKNKLLNFLYIFNCFSKYHNTPSFILKILSNFKLKTLILNYNKIGIRKAKGYKYAIVLIFVIATILRILSLNYPLQLDEALIGYESYSLLKTGKSIDGLRYPIAFLLNIKDNAMQENVILSYLLLPFIKIFGLNDIVIRLPNLIFSLLTLILLYKFTQLLFNKTTAIFCALFYAFSPWSLITATTAFNPFLLPFLYLLASYLFFLTIKIQKKYYIYLSIIPWALTFYCFNASIIWTPFLIIILSIIYFKQIPNAKKTLLISFIGITLLSIPSLLLIIYPKLSLPPITNWPFLNFPNITLTRFEQISIFSNHKGLFILPAFIFNYLLHISTIFLFIEPLNKYAVIPFNLGLLDFYLLPLIIIGLFNCYKNKKQTIYKILLIIFFAYPILPSLIDSVPTIHPTRDIIILPWIYIFAAIGAFKLFTSTTPKIIKILFIIIMVINMFFSSTIFLLKYKKHNYQTNQYANKELIEYIKTIENQYNKIIFITDHTLMDLNYNNLAFYTQYDPIKLQTEIKTNKYQSLGKYEWQNNSDLLIIQPSNLYIFNYRVIPQNNITKTIYNPDGSLAFSVVKL